MAAPADAPVITENVLYMMGSLAVATAFLTWFIADQFSRNRHLFYKIISQHNKEDDDRFAELGDSIWQIRLRNAVRDGDAPPPRSSLPRRRYLQETIDGDPGAAGAVT